MNGLWIQLLLSSVIWAEEQYFFQPNATWNDARLHCQACFKELTTITSRNVHLIVQNLSSDHWVGLRQRISNDSIPWSAWSNGEPVTYQNWYPGHPVPNKVKKLIPVCFSTTQPPTSTLITTTSSQLTSSTSTVTPTPTSLKTSTVNSSPASPSETSNKTEDMCLILIEALNCLNMTYEDLENVTKYTTKAPMTSTYSTRPTVTTYSTTPNATTFSSTFNTTTESTTNSNCVFEPEPDLVEYIDDACMTLLSFGMWKEDKCNKSLPFICYEERFFGQIYISNVTTSAGSLNWTEGPGNISHYRVELSGDIKRTFNESGLSAQIENLTAGTLYNIQVIPVKCGRDLNPQNISFYTRPSGVENLTVVSVTTDSAYLKWNKPLINANCDFYSVLSVNVDGQSRTQNCPKEECNITGLIPGSEYVFTVTATVNQTITGVPSNISEYTIPSRVLNLMSENKSNTTIKASWNEPDGKHSGYFYCVKDAINSSKCSDCKNTNIKTIDCNTTNCNISNCNITKCNIITNKFIEVTGLFPGSSYLLCVSALTKNNNISGEMVEISAYTTPNTVTLTLKPKSKTMTANWEICGRYEKFIVSIETNSTTKGHKEPINITEKTYTFTDLKAAVNYTVTVITFSGDQRSDPATLSGFTIPIVPDSVKATATGAHSIRLSWQSPKDSEGATILYGIRYSTTFWPISKEISTTTTTYAFDEFISGTVYDFEVCVRAGDLRSTAVNASAQTVPRKKSLSLAMLCSSQTSLFCGQNDAKEELITKLRKKIEENLKGVHWNLNWVDRKGHNPQSKNQIPLNPTKIV